jgi:hypothetical protein
MDKKNDASAHRYFMKVPNDAEGWQQIELAKKGLNKDRYTFVYKYNGKSIPGVYKRGYYSCVKKYATHVRVYLNVKDSVRERELVSRQLWKMESELRQEELRHEKKLFEIEESYAWFLLNK